MPPDDLGAQYVADRAQREEQDAGDALLRKFGGQSLDDKKKPDNNEVPPVHPYQLDPYLAGARVLAPVAKDVAKGAIETPRAVYTGIHDAIKNTYAKADEFSRWMGEKVGKGTGVYGLRVNETGAHVYGSRDDFEAGNTDNELNLDTAQDVIGSEMDTPSRVGNPKSVTGSLIKGVSQFMAGMAGASRVIGPLPQLEGAAATGVAALKGAMSNFAAFDPHQERLSNLLEKYPALSNPVTRYLQSKPEDGDAEGAFKNALEGLGLGGLTDGFVRGVNLLKEARGASDQLDAAGTQATAAAKPRELAPDAFTGLGNEAPNSPLVKLQKSPASLEDVAIAADDSVPPTTFINFARIDAPEDVKKVMQRLSDVGSTGKDSAKAGTRSFEAVKLDAAHKDAWQTLLDRRPGQPLSDSEALAARQLWTATTDKVAELAEIAAANPSEQNLFAFRKMLDIHDMVQREVLGARASTARALASWRIPAGGGAERLANVTAALEASGGSDVARSLAARVAALARAGMVKEMGQVIEKGAAARTRDAVLEAWVNGLLSNPVTHVANTLSNLTVLPLRMAERSIAARIGAVLGEQDGVAAGEAAAQWAGSQQGFRDMLRYYGKLAQTLLPSDSQLGGAPAAGPSPLSGMNIPQLTKLEHPPSISSDALHIGFDTMLGRAVDFVGSAVRAPGLALNASDEFFKTVGYRMELNAQAVRQATTEVNTGAITEDAFKSRVAEIIANPPESVRLASADAALYQTFNQAPGTLGKTLGKLTAEYPALKVVLPFTRTPSNILSFTFERTPLAPLMGKFRADVAAGGARRDLALAQMAVGTSAMALAADLTMSWQISGRGPAEKGVKEAMTREGWQPYSVKIGNRWVAYNRLDPAGSLLGMAADATELFMQSQHELLDDADTEKIAVAGALAFAGNVTNKTYLSGLSSMIEALNDPQRAAEGWVQRTAGSVVPAGVAQAERVNDPTVREVYSMMDAIRSRMPGLSKDLPPRRDLWGDKVKTESGLGVPFDAFSPVYSKTPDRSPIDDEIRRQGFNITTPTRNQPFKLPYMPKGEPGVSVDLSRYPKAYSDLLELSGHALENPRYGGIGLKQLLNEIVTGVSPLSPVYNTSSDGPDGTKEVMIRALISQYRDAAKAEILDRYPALRAEVESKADAKRALRFGQ